MKYDLYLPIFTGKIQYELYWSRLSLDVIIIVIKIQKAIFSALDPNLISMPTNLSYCGPVKV